MSRLHTSLAAAAATMAIAAFAIGTPRTAIGTPRTAIGTPRTAIDADARITAISLGRLIADGADIDIYDLRGASSFELLHIPGATNASVDVLVGDHVTREADIVLYDDAGPQAAAAQQRLRAEGFTRVRYLDGGMADWIARVLEPRLAVDATREETKMFEEAAELSRFFGGTPRAGVARSEIAPRTQRADSAAAANAAEQVRRRGCE